MPFQNVLDKSPWKSYCLAYNEVKRSIYELVRDKGEISHTETDLNDLLQNEIDKINLFAVVKYEDIFRSLQSLANCDASLENASGTTRLQYLERLEKSIDEISEEVINLDKYVRMNCEGLIKLVSKYDAVVQTSSVLNWFIARLSKEEFCNVNFQSLFILLSLTWSKFRSSKSDTAAASSDETWRPPESFVRSTSKYWVKPENVPRLKASILKHLPYLIFGSSVKDQQELFLDPTTLFEASGMIDSKLSETQLITSIYFDNVRKDIYKQRILRKEGARLVRFRWYGTNEGSPDQEIYIERKIHHESWANEASAKDRFVIPQKDVFRFMKGKFNVDEFFNKDGGLTSQGPSSGGPSDNPSLELAHEVDTMLKSLSLQPFIRTCYYRSAFQLATSNSVRISLDTQMLLINEFKPNGHPVEPWCRFASDVLAEEDLVRFPYAILEVKLGDAQNPPPWVEQMLLDCGGVKVYKFSKFLHAMAFLHAQNISILPHWFTDFLDTAGDRTIEENASNRCPAEKIFFSSASSDHVSSPILASSDGGAALLTVKPTESAVPVKDMKSIEPKSIFANERTFLHYMQKAGFLITVAISLGTAFAFVPILLCLISLGYMYVMYNLFVERQTHLLSSRKSAGQKLPHRLDLKSGPVMAALVVIIGSIGSFIKTSLGDT